MTSDSDFVTLIVEAEAREGSTVGIVVAMPMPTITTPKTPTIVRKTEPAIQGTNLAFPSSDAEGCLSRIKWRVAMRETSAPVLERYQKAKTIK